MASVMDPNTFLYALLYKFRLENWFTRYYNNNIIFYLFDLYLNIQSIKWCKRMERGGCGFISLLVYNKY